MTIPTIPGISGTQTSQSVSNASTKLQAAITSIVNNNISASDNEPDVSIASQLQSQTSGLKQISSNLVQALSLSQVANGGVTQLTAILGQLQTLVTQAQTPALDISDRMQINQQINQLTDELNEISNTTSFNDQPLLDGSLSGENALSLGGLLSDSSDTSDALSLPDLSTQSLLGGQSLTDNPQATGIVADALEKLTDTGNSIDAFQQLVEFASANIDSALANQQAAQSTLSDADFAAANSNDALINMQNNAATALEAQGNRLSPALLQLVG